MWEKRLRRCSTLVLLLLVALVVLLFRDYGITWDEGAQSDYGRRILRWWAQQSPLRRPFEAMGALMHISDAEAGSVLFNGGKWSRAICRGRTRRCSLPSRFRSCI
ncbi:MAG TPA: hypothetical protein VGL15_01830 [Vicinamibacteria bacterium]